MRDMTRETFTVGTDAHGRRFIYQATHELDKNHDGNDRTFETIGETSIYEVPGSPKCPVQSYLMYLSVLNPKQKAIWQKPKASVRKSEKIWYQNMALGEKSLSNFMPEMSKKYGLSRRYTNHCLRVTSTQTLDDANVESHHIIRVTGHKSESSVKNYARRLSSQKKKEISDIYTAATGLSEEASCLPESASASPSISASCQKIYK